MKQRRTPIRLALALTLASVLAGCGTVQPASVAGLRNVVGTDLIGARGATDRDQRKIDRTVAGICATAVWTRSECARHDTESRAGQ